MRDASAATGGPFSPLLMTIIGYGMPRSISHWARLRRLWSGALVRMTIVGRAGPGRHDLRRTGRRVDVADLVLEEGVEQLAARRNVDVFLTPEGVDVLEERELVDPHFQAVAPDESLEAGHEHGQHLVDVDDDQRSLGIDVKPDIQRRCDWKGRIGQRL